ncbi:MAG: thiamine pyrophosphate-dependent enzyme, partial [Halobacteria archaeon]|nr:thiamine pyrophosphate-dependent enzyme [Halobacteria archaeon]
DWAISMPKDRVTDVEDGSKRAGGFDMPGVRVDYDDAVAVYEAAKDAVERARAGNGPTLMEIQVHRRMGHFMGDPQVYRSEEDEERHQKLDSIERLEEDLRNHGVEDDTMEEIRDRSHRRVEEAIEWAKDQPQPDPEEAYEDVFTNPPEGVTEIEPTVEADGGEK